ncbi:MAG: peptidylprolyl isomerase [Mangrovicoccus sp.]
MIRLLVLGLLLSLMLVFPPAAIAQAQLFQPAIRVNEGVVTQFEIEQRLDLLKALRSPNVTRERVIDDLIDDRLRLEAAAQLGTLPESDEVIAALEEFAARGGMSGEDLLMALARVGIARETLEYYLRANAAWRNLVLARFGRQARIGSDELDRAIALSGQSGGVRILLSEIILQIDTFDPAGTEALIQEIQSYTSFTAFENAARQYSAAGSRVNGGRMDWVPLSELPPRIAPIFLTLKPGSVAPPVQLDGAVALFQLRGIQDSRPPNPTTVELDYMMLRPADPRAELARITTQTDQCVDLFTLYPEASEAQLDRRVQDLSEVPAAIRAQLALLDAGEAGIVSGENTIVMLCSRTPKLDEELNRDAIRQRLFSEKLDELADGYLAELRANAYIEEL